MKVLSKLSMFIFILLTLAACTPTKELKDLSIVEAVGYDIANNGNFNLTFQIFNPKSSGGGGGNEKKSSGESPVIIAEGEGDGIYDAIRNTTLTIGRKLYFSNSRIHLVSEDVCNKYFDKLIDFLERPTEIRPNEYICAVKGTAKGALTAKKEEMIIPAQNIQEIIINYGTSSKFFNTQLEDIFEAESTGVTDIAIPALKIIKDEQGNDVVMMDGTAIFRRNKLAAYLDNSETRGALFILGKVTSGIIVTKPSYGGSISMEITGAKSDISVIMKKDKPAIKINVSIITDVAEIETPKDIVLNNNILNDLKSLQVKEVKKEIESAITKVLRQYGCDIFGFGYMIFQDEPDAWKKIKNNWLNEIYNLPVEVNVSSEIVHSGLITDKTTLK